MDFIKAKTFMHQRTLSRVKRQPAEWEKVSANHKSDQDLVSTIRRELIEFTSYRALATEQQKDKPSNLKRGKGLNRHFSKEDIKWATKYEEKLNFTGHQGKANPNHNETPLHTH